MRFTNIFQSKYYFIVLLAAFFIGGCGTDSNQPIPNDEKQGIDEYQNTNFPDSFKIVSADQESYLISTSGQKAKSYNNTIKLSLAVLDAEPCALLPQLLVELIGLTTASKFGPFFFPAQNIDCSSPTLQFSFRSNELESYNVQLKTEEGKLLDNTDTKVSIGVLGDENPWDNIGVTL